jgi:hypothetical protein
MSEGEAHAYDEWLGEQPSESFPGGVLGVVARGLAGIPMF